MVQYQSRQARPKQDSIIIVIIFGQKSNRRWSIK